jgi:hypothetical protein
MDNIVEFPGAPGPLEAVELLCLTYLRRAKSPVVSVRALFEYCLRELDAMPMDPPAFLEFLRRHREITVVEGLAGDAPLQKDLFDAAGFDLGPRAISNDRMPSRVDMVQMMAGQLRDMLAALERVRAQAELAKDTARLATIDAATARAQKLLESIKYLG